MECPLKVDYREQLINLIILIHEIIIKLYLSKIMMLKQQQISLIVIEGKKTSLFERILRKHSGRPHHHKGVKKILMKIRRLRRKRRAHHPEQKL